MARTPLALPTRHGVFWATYSASGLARLEFPPSEERPPALAEVAAPTTGMTATAEWHRTASAAVARILDGLEPRQLPPLDLAEGTTFQRSVWNELLRIPLGQTRTYGEIARRLALPGAARAVGAACGANPVPLIVPCHRVVAAGGRLGGFSGGAGWKEKLLAIEQAAAGFSLQNPSAAPVKTRAGGGRAA
jgi:O-6-methylguanine DNA methyltransferase